MVIDKINHILRCNTEKTRIGARKCTVVEIDKKIAMEFLEKYHIQGYSSSSKCYGAYYKDTLVAVMTFIREEDGLWNLNRYSTNTDYIVQGMANKIFKYFIHNNYVASVKSFLDLRWGCPGNSVYEKIGFVVDEIERPDYRYVVDGKRLHKFNFRKDKINKKYGLPKTMTESEMVKKLGISRIWDCGLVRYVYQNN